MGYIEDLRKIVGHRPLILMGAAVMVFNSDRELLLLLRKDNLTWCFPGGMMEPGETVEETALREVFEETGLRLSSLKMFRLYSGPGNYYRYPNGDETHNVSVVYLAELPESEIRLCPDEHTDFGFFALDALPNPIHPSILMKIEDYQKSVTAVTNE